MEQLQKQLSWRALAGQASTEAGNEDSRLAGMEKELEEQEKLITGFQTENERLYAELKKLRVSSKEAEALMFSDNQKLRVDIAMLRWEDSLHSCFHYKFFRSSCFGIMLKKSNLYSIDYDMLVVLCPLKIQRKSEKGFHIL